VPIENIERSNNPTGECGSCMASTERLFVCLFVLFVCFDDI